MYSSITIFVAIATMFQRFSTVSGSEITFPEECNSARICYHKPQNYPHAQIDDLIEEKMQNSNYTFFGQNEYIEEELRDSSVGDGDNCLAQIEIKQPFGIKVGNKWKPVIQSKHFSQKIRQVTCKEEAKSCFELDGYLSRMGMRGVCTTKFGKLFIHFYDPVDNKMGAVNMILPICCGCNIIEVDK